MTDLSEVRQRFVAEMAQYIEPVNAAAGATGSLRDAAEEAGLAVRFFDDAMKKARDGAEEARAAAEMLGLSLEGTSHIAEKARNKLLELGFAEREAAAGARKLAEAQIAAAIATSAARAAAGGGGLLTKGMEALANPGGGLAFAIGAAAAITLLPAIVTEVSALAGGLTAAAAGFGALAVFAVPALHHVSTAYQGVTAAQKAFRAAQQLEAADPTKAHLAAQQLALVKLKIAWKDLTPAERQVVAGVNELKTQFNGLEKALQPGMMKLFADGLKIAKPLLNDLGAFAGNAIGPIDGLLKQLGKFVISSGFKDWLGQLMKLEGPSITAIGHGIGNIATNLGKFVTALPPADVVNGLNIAFRVVSATIHILTNIVHNAREQWHFFSTAAVDAWHAIDQVSHDIARDWDGLIHAGERLYQRLDQDWNTIKTATGAAVGVIESDIKGFLARVAGDWDSGWSKVIAFTGRIPGDIIHALGDLGSLLIHDGEQLIGGLISGIESAIPGLSAAVSTVRGLLSALSGGGSVGAPPATAGLGAAATGALGGHGPHNAGMAVVQHAFNVRVDVGGAVMSHPAAQQALARHVQAAVLDFAQANSGSMLVLPGRGA